MRKLYSLASSSLAVVLTLALGGCSKEPSKSEVSPAKLAIFKPLPAEMTSDKNPITPEKIALGRMLYYEPRLSKSQKISCNSCHDLANYGVDGQPTSDGHKGQKGDRNSPTVFNAAGHVAQFWDGRAATIEDQAKGPVMNPVEMAMPSEKVVLAVLKSMPEYIEAFQKAFPADKDPVSLDNMARAIGAFERKLVTPARWDKFLQGDAKALTDEEKIGLNVFVDTGCGTCHMGTYLGGAQFQRLGLIKPYPDSTDPGRFKVTKSEADLMSFKVPSLRNVTKTGPYFHNGKVASIEEATRQMGEFQLGRLLKPEEIHAIVTWLGALTGEISPEYVKPPTLPKGTAKTPKPDLTD